MRLQSGSFFENKLVLAKFSLFLFRKQYNWNNWRNLKLQETTVFLAEQVDRWASCKFFATLLKLQKTCNLSKVASFHDRRMDVISHYKSASWFATYVMKKDKST